jgi:hypothetical protein
MKCFLSLVETRIKERPESTGGTIREGTDMGVGRV